MSSHVNRPIIMEARDVARSRRGEPPPTCPVCGIRVMLSGRGQPFVVGPTGQVYCRDHGETVLPGYKLRLEGYERRRKAMGELLARIEAAGPVAPEDEAWARSQVDRLDLDDEGQRR